MDILYWTGAFVVAGIILSIVVYFAAKKEVDKTDGDQD